MIGLYALGIFLLWLWLTWLLVKFGWRNCKQGINTKSLGIGLIVLAWFAASFWYGGGRKVYYDWQVNQMCAKDGGVTIYESVELPAEQYDRYAKRNWVLPDESDLKPSDEYYYSRERIISHISNLL